MPFTLLHPGLFALGIACVSIPIILHLLKRKRRPIEWGAMRFLEQAYRKRRRILTIEQLILLALRCLTLMLIAMGVGSLMLGSAFSPSIPTTMIIVIDQSIGSALIDPDTQRSSLDINKSMALESLDRLDPLRGDLAMLITTAQPAAGVVVPESSDIAAVRLLIEQLQPTDSASDLSTALSLARGYTQDPEHPTHTELVIAASHRGLTTQSTETANTPAMMVDRLLVSSPSDRPIENVGITSATPTRSLVTNTGVTLPASIRVELMRSGTDARSTDINIFDHQSTQIGHQKIRWNTGQQTSTSLVAIDPTGITPIGARTAIIRVQINQDANARDNIQLVPIATRSTIRVGVIHQPSRTDLTNPRASSISPARWVRAALAPSDDFGISIIDIDASQASSLLAPNLDAVVVLSPSDLDSNAWDRIGQLSSQGALIVFTPDTEQSSIGWLDQMNTLSPGLITAGSVLRDHEEPILLSNNQAFESTNLLAGIESEFDQLARSVSISRSIRFAPGSQSQIITTLSDDAPFILKSSSTNTGGTIVLFACAFDLGWMNLPARPMFVPMMQEIIRQGVGQGSSTPTIKAGDPLPTQPWVISSHRVPFDSQPLTQNLSKQSTISNMGLVDQLDSLGATRAFVAINPDAQGSHSGVSNAEDAQASILQLVDTNAPSGIEWITPTEQAQRSSPDLKDDQGSPSQGISIALWMLMAAGVLAALETVLARLFTAKMFDEAIPTQGGAR